MRCKLDAQLLIANRLKPPHPPLPRRAVDPSAPVDSQLGRFAACCLRAADPAVAASDEVLYGRAGTLLGAVTLQRELGGRVVDDATLEAICRTILQSGAWGGEGRGRRVQATVCWHMPPPTVRSNMWPSPHTFYNHNSRTLIHRPRAQLSAAPARPRRRPPLFHLARGGRARRPLPGRSPRLGRRAARPPALLAAAALHRPPRPGGRDRVP